MHETDQMSYLRPPSPSYLPFLKHGESLDARESQNWQFRVPLLTYNIPGEEREAFLLGGRHSPGSKSAVADHSTYIVAAVAFRLHHYPLFVCEG